MKLYDQQARTEFLAKMERSAPAGIMQRYYALLEQYRGSRQGGAQRSAARLTSTDGQKIAERHKNIDQTQLQLATLHASLLRAETLNTPERQKIIDDAKLSLVLIRMDMDRVLGRA